MRPRRQSTENETKPVILTDSLRLNFRMLTVFGFWLPDGLDDAKKRAYVIYSVLTVGFCFIAFTLTELVNFYRSLHDLTKLTEASFLLLTHTSELFKFHRFAVDRRRILRLMRRLDATATFQPRDAAQRRILTESIRYTIALYRSFAGTCVLCVFLWAVSAALVTADSTSTRFVLPLAGWYPFAIERRTVFVAVYVYQIFSAILNVFTNISMDTTATGFMAHICAQLDLLNGELVDVRSRAETNVRRTGTNGLAADAVRREMHDELIRCVRHHVDIIEMADEVSELFNFVVLCQFATGCIVICLTMFQLTLVGLFTVQFYSMVVYQLCMLIELSFYCWYGNQIILKSSELSNSVYASDWTDCDVPYKKMMLIVMARTNKPMKLYAGNLFALSLDTFLSILRTSWSYFAVLNRVHSREL